MQTPAGKDCPHYYADFHRGRDIQECRLLKDNLNSLRWQPSDCALCPVPDILKANASPDLRLNVTIEPRLWKLGRRFVVEASCARHHIAVENPYVGCPQCNAERPGLEAFLRALEESDD